MQPRITIVDYGLGNIFSVRRAFEFLGSKVETASSTAQIEDADFLVLPGVGAFKKGMQTLEELGYVKPIKSHAMSGKPILGICLGMQLLFESSEENGETKGLGLIDGKVVRIVSKEYPIKVPHIGWGRLRMNQLHENAKLFEQTLQDKFAYFVHSYHPIPKTEHLLATTKYFDATIHAVVKKENIIGCQFHPEKSGVNMLNYLHQLTFGRV